MAELDRPSSRSREWRTNSAVIEKTKRYLSLRGVPSDRVRLSGHNPSTDLVALVEQLLEEAVCIVASIDDKFDKSDPEVSEKSKWRTRSIKTYKGAKETGGDVTVDVALLTKNYKCRVNDETVGPGKSESTVSEPRTKYLSFLNKNTERVVDPPGQTEPMKCNTEQWACRRSYHADQRRAGTASWDEFYTYMKKEHVATEKGMTDTVANAETWCSWAGAGDIAPDTFKDIGLPGSQWSDFTLSVVEMEHDVGPGLQNRVFPVVQMTCQNVPMHEIYVISAPIDNWASWAIPSIGTKLSERHRTVLGSYASVEVFRRVEPAAGAPGEDVVPAEARTTAEPDVSAAPSAEASSDRAGNATHWIQWTMATVSDARGALPMALQRPFVPSKIAEDVPMFTRWMLKKRTDLSP